MLCQMRNSRQYPCSISAEENACVALSNISDAVDRGYMQRHLVNIIQFGGHLLCFWENTKMKNNNNNQMLTLSLHAFMEGFGLCNGRAQLLTVGRVEEEEGPIDRDARQPRPGSTLRLQHVQPAAGT